MQNYVGEAESIFIISNFSLGSSLLSTCVTDNENKLKYSEIERSTNPRRWQKYFYNF